MPMIWGFLLLQDGRAPRRVTNFRDDKALTSSFWRGSVEQRRCAWCQPRRSEAQRRREAGYLALVRPQG